MKQLLIAATIALSSAFAHAGSNIYDLVCVEHGTKNKVSIKLDLLNNAQWNEYQAVPAVLTVKRIVSPKAEVIVHARQFTGLAGYEDVVTDFKASNGKASFTFYADEHDQTSLKIDGLRYTYDCEFND